ncbi:unnamed protein product, partial [Mesorhabditis spiculigera]
MWLILFFVLITITASEKISVNKKCRDLLACAIRKECVALEDVVHKFENKTASVQMYNDLDKSVDYGCIFSTGCYEECEACPLCISSKQQVVDVLSGNKLENSESCHELINCAGECVKRSSSDIDKINHCLRHTCAYSCFDGSCPKCSAFVTRIFNQICVSGDLRNKVAGFTGQCPELFREIVYAKFKAEFDAHGTKPMIGKHGN